MASSELPSSESAQTPVDQGEGGRGEHGLAGGGNAVPGVLRWPEPGFLPLPDDVFPSAETGAPSSQQEQDAPCPEPYSISSIKKSPPGYEFRSLYDEERVDEIAASFGEAGRKWTPEGRVRDLLDTHKATPLWEKVREKGIDPVSALHEIYEEDPYTWMEIVMNAAGQAVAEAEYGLTGNLQLHRRWAKALLSIFSLPPSAPETSKP